VSVKASAQSQVPRRRRIDARQAARTAARVCADWPSGDVPGFVLGLSGARGSLAQRAAGVTRAAAVPSADDAGPITADTVFNLNCLCKPILGMGVALAELNADLRASDPVRHYLPELPACCDGMTVSHLVHHTSGLRDLAHLVWICGAGELAADQVYALIARQRALLHPPGARFLYSRTGYFLLCRILARLLGDLTAWFDTNLFQPLRLRMTTITEDPGRVRGPQATGHHREGDGHGAVTVRHHHADVGVYSTLNDLLRWDRYCRAPQDACARLLLARCLTCGRLNNGATVPYAYGVSVWSHGGQTIVSHAARDQGFSHALMRFPDAGLSILMLANLTEADAELRAMRIADTLLGTGIERMFGAAAAPPPTAGARDGAPRAHEHHDHDLARWAGRYHCEELDMSYDVVLDADGLSMLSGQMRTTLRRVGADDFRSRQIRVTFTSDSAGRAAGCVISSMALGRLQCVRA
jgi:CubicO group peptidase (beta-lactamase class C family)